MKALVILCLLLCGAVASFGQTNLMTNGDFSANSSRTNTAISVTKAQITGWTITVGNASGAAVYYAKTGQTVDDWIPWAPSGSTYSIQLDSASGTAPGTPDTISQTVANLKNNYSYNLTFSMASEANRTNDGLHPTSDALDVIITGVTSGKTYYNSTTAPTPPFTSTLTYNQAQGDVPWYTYTLSFTMTSNESVTIKFQDNAVSSSNNPSLANVILVQTPEVSHWAMFLGFGVGAFLLDSRRRKRAVSPA